MNVGVTLSVGRGVGVRRCGVDVASWRNGAGVCRSASSVGESVRVGVTVSSDGVGVPCGMVVLVSVGSGVNVGSHVLVGVGVSVIVAVGTFVGGGRFVGVFVS